MGVLVLIILLANSLPLQQKGKARLCGLGSAGAALPALGGAGSRTEAVFSFLLSFLWAGLSWPVDSRRNGPGMTILLSLDPRGRESPGSPVSIISHNTDWPTSGHMRILWGRKVGLRDWQLWPDSS